MRKLITFIVISTCAIIFTVTAYAEDRFSLSGEYRARAWDIDTNSTDQAYVDQRMRVKASMKVADDVTVVIRADIAEAKWALDFTTGSVARPGNPSNTGLTKLHIDRTYVKINKETWNLVVGQQFYALGIMEIMDSELTGVNFGLKLKPVTVNLSYFKIDEGGATTDDSTLGTEDTDIYSAKFGMKLGAFKSQLFFAMLKDDSVAANEPWGAGFYINGALGNINIISELGILGGDSATTDYSGLQFFFKADSKVTDMIKVGGELYYAQGDEDDTQITALTNFGDWTPFVKDTPFNPNGGILGSNEFNPFGGAGSMGLAVIFTATPMAKLSFGGKLGYWESEEDSVADGDLTGLNIWASYEIASSTKLSAIYAHSEKDISGTETEKDTLGLQLSVKF